MHRKLISIFIIACLTAPAFSQTFRTQAEATYYDLPKIQSPYINGIDPYEHAEYAQYIWSPYPLFRASSRYYFKREVIKEGYYLLTPRFEEGYNVVIFKQRGRVKHMIPAYKTEKINPLTFYAKKEPPKPKKALWKKVACFPWTAFKWPFKKLFGRKVMPKEMPKTYMETYDLDKNFYGIDFYYEDTLYKLMLRTTPEQK